MSCEGGRFLMLGGRSTIGNWDLGRASEKEEVQIRVKRFDLRKLS